MRTRRMLGTTLILFFIVAAATSPAGAHGRGDRDGAKEVFTGTLVGIGGPAAGRTRSFTLTLTGQTPSADVERDLALLGDNGQDAFKRAVSKERLGTFALDGEVGHDVNFVVETSTPEGRRITIVFDRWENIFELRNGTRSLDYPFTYIELSLDATGRGSGMLVGAAKVYFDRDDPSNLTVENFGVYPVRLLDVAEHR